MHEIVKGFVQFVNESQEEDELFAAGLISKKEMMSHLKPQVEAKLGVRLNDHYNAALDYRWEDEEYDPDREDIGYYPLFEVVSEHLRTQNAGQLTLFVGFSKIDGLERSRVWFQGLKQYDNFDVYLFDPRTKTWTEKDSGDIEPKIDEVEDISEFLWAMSTDLASITAQDLQVLMKKLVGAYHAWIDEFTKPGAPDPGRR